MKRRQGNLKLVSVAGLHEQGAKADVARKIDIDWTILMARAQDGDSQSYLLLLQEITPYLRYRASMFHRDPEDIEDTVQDILLTIHAVRHTYDPSRPFGPWLACVANRRAFDRLRRQGRQRAHEVPLAPNHEVIVADIPSIEDLMFQASLAGAIATLPPVQQQVLRLLKFNEMSLKEASLVTGMSTAALKMTTYRALQKLRLILGERGGKK